MKKYYLLLASFLLVAFLYSCTKTESMLNDASLNKLKKSSTRLHSMNLLLPIEGYTPPAGSLTDTVETPTILGAQLPNPFSLDNMTMAYNIVHSTQISRLTPTNLYVRFLPSSISQLNTLADSLDLDLFDTPMDYSIVQEGDYYQDPAIPMEQITWQYAVVTPGFQFPAGITHEILDSIYIPSNADSTVEDMAFQLAGDPDIDEPPTVIATTANQVHPYATGSTYHWTQPNVLQCPDGYHWDFEDMSGCVPDNCDPGMHWDYAQQACVVDAPHLPPPPPPGPNRHYPAGHLKVFDTNLNKDVALRNVRVVAKRWFKVTRLYTDDNGYFESSRRFHKKAKIIVKFKNHDAVVRCVRGVRVWQAYFPVRVNLGKWSGTLNNITHTFTRNSNNDSKGTRYWMAATVNNAVQEYKDMAGQLGIGTPNSGRLSIVMSNWGPFEGSAATPMYGQYQGGATLDDVQHFIENFAVITPFQSLIAGGVRAVAKVFMGRADIIFGYNSGIYSESDRVKETLYHELTHAAHFAKVGGAWWGAFRAALISESIYSIGGDDNPYGDGTSSINSPIIALAEGWAYHIGYEMEDMQYGLNCSPFKESDGNSYYSTGGISSAEHFEEEFNPNLTSDPFHWIPKGLFHDLMDTRNDVLYNQEMITDEVSGYTEAEFFNALDNDVNDLGDYRINLLQENGNNQAIQVNQLFNEYGY